MDELLVEFGYYRDYIINSLLCIMNTIVYFYEIFSYYFMVLKELTKRLPLECAEETFLKHH